MRPSRSKRKREVSSVNKCLAGSAEYFTSNVILSGAHFNLFNSLYDAQLDLGELARHIWGCEMTTHETIACESAALKDFIRPNQAKGSIFQPPSSKKAQRSSALFTSANDLSSGANEGAVLRIRFPRTVAFRERIEESEDELETENGDIEYTNGEAVAKVEEKVLSMDDLPQLSLLSSLHNTDGFTSQPHFASATPIFASTAFGATTMGEDLAQSKPHQRNVGNAFNMSSNIMQSTVFGGGISFGEGQPALYEGGSASGLSELYQSVLSSDVHGSTGRKGSGIAPVPEATVDDLLTLTNGSAGSNNVTQAAAEGSLFGMAAKFLTTKLDAPDAGNLLVAEDLLPKVTVEVVPPKRKRKASLRKIVFDSVFCTVTRKGGVTVFGPIPAEELSSVAQMVHEYVSRAILTCCPWCVSLSVTAQAAPSRTSVAELPPISPKEMITCGSAAEWNSHVKQRLDRVIRKRKAEDDSQRLQILRDNAFVEASLGMTSSTHETDGFGFALPFVPAKTKSLTETHDTLEEASELEGGDVISVRLRRLQSLLSIEARGHSEARDRTVPGLLPKPSIAGFCELSDWLSRVVPKTALLDDHGLRITNMMCHLAWASAACARMAEVRGSGNNISRPKHLTVAEFETFVANVGRWAMMKRKSDSSSSFVEVDCQPQPRGGMKHSASNSFSSRSKEVVDRQTLGNNEESWTPRGVVVVSASSHDFCRFEWHFEGRVVEVVAQRRSATFRIVVAQDTEDCKYVANTLLPVCLGLE